MPLAVSVLVPMYQAERTIRQCLVSVLGQSLRDLEVLVVDDGSTDGGPDIVRAVAAADPRVRLLHNPENRGVSAALNAGLTAARSPLVARLDADDEALPGRLETQQQLFGSRSDLGVCGSFVEYVGRPGRRLLGTVPVTHDDITYQLRTTTSSPFFHPSVMFRRTVVVDAGGYRTFFRNAEDYDLWLRLLGRCSFHNLPQPLTRYRLSLSGASLGPVREQWMYALLAKTAWERPDEPLEALWREVQVEMDEARLAAAERAGRLRFARLLADSGQLPTATRYLYSSRSSVGAAAALRFLAGRARRRLRSGLAFDGR